MIYKNIKYIIKDKYIFWRVYGSKEELKAILCSISVAAFRDFFCVDGKEKEIEKTLDRPESDK